MTLLPISFSGPMVRAILDGRKQQTRRLAWQGDGSRAATWQRMKPGDALWVREAVRAEERADGMDGVRYAADDAWRPIANTPEASARWIDLRGTIRPDAKTGPWRWPRFMPRWASRLSLTITNVRMQRLREITEADAMAEGATPILVPPDGGSAPHVEGFRVLWETLHGEGAWDANPEVVALSFLVATRGKADAG